nr:helix-turn-helix domain-containing protein [Burkholderia sp. Ac-20379]
MISIPEPGSFDTLPCVIGGILKPADLAGTLDEFARNLRRTADFDKCLIMHGRQDGATTHGLVHRYGHALTYRPSVLACGPVVPVRDYLQGFELSDRHDHAYRWGDPPTRAADRNGDIAELAFYMRGGSGGAAYVPWLVDGTEQGGTLLQVQCRDVSAHLLLLLSFITLQLHDALSRKMCASDYVQPDASAFKSEADLTRKEREVVKWIVEGKTSWEIGRILHMSERTVKYHLTNVYGKLRVANRAQAIAKVSRLDLL